MRQKTLRDYILENYKVYFGDVWVADYTEQTKYRPIEEQIGVVIRDSPFEEIQAFHLKNETQGLSYYGLNIEDVKEHFPRGVQDCECFFRVKGLSKGWVLLCELKYGKDVQINNEQNATKAYDQLLDTYEELLKHRLFDKKHCRTYLNISLPLSNERPPFTSFLVTQDDRLKQLRRHGARVSVLGYNELVSVNSGMLSVPTVDI